MKRWRTMRRSIIFVFVATAVLTALSNIRHLLQATAAADRVNIQQQHDGPQDYMKIKRPPAMKNLTLQQLQEQQDRRRAAMDQNVALFGIQSSESDIAYLEHCNLSALNAEAFGIMRDVVLSKVATVGGGFAKVRGPKLTARLLQVNESSVIDEVSLQTLEVYAQYMGVCNFQYYQPTVILSNTTEMQQIQHRIMQIPTTLHDDGTSCNITTTSTDTDTGTARLVFVISAFDDFPQLEALVESIHLPHHLIIIHLERRAPLDFVQQVASLLRGQERFSKNVILLQFGTIIYPSGSLTHVMLSIMQWIVMDMDFAFDYFITMSASAFPLYSAKEMARYLYTDTKRIRLGAMYTSPSPTATAATTASQTENQQLFPVETSLAISVTRGLGDKQRIFKSDNIADLLQRVNVTRTMTTRTTLSNHLKSNSGNTAAFDRLTLLQLLNSSPRAKQILASSKLSTFCCSEEHVWIQAMEVIGRKSQAILPGAVWQAWECPSSEANARLVHPEASLTNNGTTNHRDEKISTTTTNDKICLRVDENSGRRTIVGKHALEQELIQAKRRGNLYARKFHSSDSYWMEWIKTNLHDQTT